MHKQIDHIMQKEMSRKEFIATLGLAMASVMGFSSLIRLLSGKPSSSRHSSGYGSSPYGR